ncbi:uncharacterized protein LOC131258384 isoform X2 [Magnolia sinica]|uniref:uncharacterized protein LOC131258384 isoform X2 n=1 Tax=Magnolia sinica TaxID=86752 RepID=UPI00265846BA|nr:uncharacterized protein LOC131258384 isoform X2 [Magnolia sinica]
MDPSSKEKSSQAVSPVDSGAAKSLLSVTDITERTMKLPHGYPSLSRYHSNFSRSMFWRRARQRYGNQYSRRVSSSSIDILSSLRKTVVPLCDERLSIKLNSHYNSESGYHEESRGKAFFRPQRIRSNALVMESASSDVANMEF